MAKGKKKKTTREVKKSEGTILFPPLISVPLQETFLGYRRTKGSYNQLWRWDNLEDIKQ